MNFQFGIITLAFGSSKYIEMSINLAKSLNLLNKDIPRCVVTTPKHYAYLSVHFDHVVFIDEKLNGSNSLIHKLYLYEYSPFQNTLFIDSDCLVLRELSELILLLSDHSFSNTGDEISEGEWFMDVKSILDRYNLASLPKWNGGTYFFKKDIISRKVFDVSRSIFSKYSEIGLKSLGQMGINEEPIFAIACAVLGLKAIKDKHSIGMYTPLGLIGDFQIDIVTGKCVYNKNGVIVSPSIAHFCGSLSAQFHYSREVFKLRLLTSKYPILIIRILEFVMFNAPYITYVFLKRTAKVLIGRKGVKFNILKPLYSNY